MGQADPRALADDGLSPYTAAILKEASLATAAMQCSAVSEETAKKPCRTPAECLVGLTAGFGSGLLSSSKLTL